MDEPTVDLSIATTDELVEELGRRSECYVVMALLKCDQRNDKQNCAKIWYDGGHYTAMGLAAQAYDDLLHKSVGEHRRE